MKTGMRLILVLSAGIVLVGALSWAVLRGPASEEPPFRVGTNVWLGYEPLYLAQSLGYLKGQGVSLRKFDTTLEVIEAFRLGLLEAAAVTLDEALRLAESGPEIRIVLVMDVSNGGDVILGQPELAAVSDLRGKRIAVEESAVGGYLLARALEIAEVRPEDVILVHLPIDRHLDAFRAHEVDAVAYWEVAIRRYG